MWFIMKKQPLRGILSAHAGDLFGLSATLRFPIQDTE